MAPAGESSVRLSIVHGPTFPPLQRITFGNLIRQRSQNSPNGVALISQHQDEILTYRVLHKRSDDLAAGLLAAGVGKGDRVAVLLGNRSEYVDVFFACAKVQAIITLLNYAYTPAELKHTLSSTKAKILITNLKSGKYDYSGVLRDLQRTIKCLEKVVILPNISGREEELAPSPYFTRYSDFLRRGSQKRVDFHSIERRISHLDILNLQFTSGSTGLPKAAALTHNGLLNTATYMGQHMGIKDTDKIVIPVPFFHAFGFVMGLCACFVAGATAVIPSEYFDADAALRAVEKYSSTGLYGVTTMWIDMLSHPKFSKTKRDSLRFGMISGSAMPEGLLVRVGTRFPIAQLNTNWGMTELSSVVTMTMASDPLEKKLRTAGRLLPNFTAKIVEPNTGRVLPWGHRGEIVINGYGVMDSYFGDKAKTAEALKQHTEDDLLGGVGRDADGKLRIWMHTGDEAYFDPEGYFVITGRIKDLIIRGGENISPVEIEERLYHHTAIKQAAVFGIPSQRYGEEVAALLEVESGMRRPSDDEIRSWVRQTLARFKTPVKIWWLGDSSRGIPSEWPKTSNGKLRKKDIREMGIRLMKRPAEAETVPLRPSL